MKIILAAVGFITGDIDNYRRVSTGWRVDNTDWHYKEGLDFSCFNYDNKRILIGLCGDL